MRHRRTLLDQLLGNLPEIDPVAEQVSFTARQFEAAKQQEVATQTA